jgi:TolA-binding protein
MKSIHPRATIVALIVLLTAAWLGRSLRAEELGAENAFGEAIRLFQGSWFDRAEKGFADFVAGFPQSTNRYEAMLLQAQCRYQLNDYEGAANLLSAQVTAAGPLADRFLYWLAEARLKQNQFEAAAKTYGQLLQQFPNSSLRLEAGYGEAFARYQLGEVARTVDLLTNPTGPFGQAAKNSTNRVVLVRGSFLLAEALYSQGDFVAAEHMLTELPQLRLSQELESDRQYLLARVEVAEQRDHDALARVTNLVAVATATTNLVLQTRSLGLKAEILQAKDPDGALQAYEQIIALPGIGPDQSRQALFKLVDIMVGQQRFTNAAQRLERYLEQNPQEPAADLIRLTLGEVYLKQFYAGKPTPPASNVVVNPVVATNLLRLARNQFEVISNQMTNSPYLGKAQLDRGWCFWEEAQLSGEAAPLVECEGALQSAIQHLPKSMDQATARFKLGDCAYRRKDFTNAVDYYTGLLDQYRDFPEAKENLLDHALNQLIRASVEGQNLGRARTALDRLLQDFPNSRWCSPSFLYYANALLDAGEVKQAREAFAEFERRFPNSPLVAEAQLGSARTYAKEAEWSTAIQRLGDWLARNSKHQARPQAEFERAWCYDQSGAATNAFGLFTNLLQQFPTSAYAPLAQLWVADYYLNEGRKDNAERYYQMLFESTNAVPLALSKHGQIMAAKTAVFRQAYKEARFYLTNVYTASLLNDPELGPEAWFMLGDIELEDPSRESANKTAKFEDAIIRFQRIVSLPEYSGSKLVPLALGKIAECNSNLGAQSSGRYDMATNQYAQVINHPLSDASTRAQAEVGLGQVLVKMADSRSNRTELLEQALGHYLKVAYAAKDSQPDLFWTQKAALAAGTLAVERLQRFDEAERLYRTMLQTMPSLRATWESRLEALRQRRLPVANNH